MHKSCILLISFFFLSVLGASFQNLNFEIEALAVKLPDVGLGKKFPKELRYIEQCCQDFITQLQTVGDTLKDQSKLAGLAEFHDSSMEEKAMSMIENLEDSFQKVTSSIE
eukprot:Platyproteum_vivax@DN13898_c0_g1_i1.p1